MRSRQEPSALLISGVFDAVASWIASPSPATAPPCTRSLKSIRSARVRLQSTAKVGLAWPRSIWESIDFDTPDSAASCSSVRLRALRSR